MEQWLSNVVLPTAIAVGVMLLVMWPTERSGTRLLRDWGVPDPDPDQVDEAVSYLRQRRFLYAVLFVLVPPLANLVLPDTTGVPGLAIAVPLLGAMVIAELFAALRPASGVRVASLNPRDWRDLVPRWAVVAGVVLVVLVVVWSAAGLVAQPWVNRYAAALAAQEENPPAGGHVDYSDGWLAEMTTPVSLFALGSAAVAVALTALLVRLAVRRPAVADEAVDAALRVRTARVAVGICLGWLGTAVTLATERIRFFPDQEEAGLLGLPARPAWLVPELDTVSSVVAVVAVLGAIGCWIWVANPSRRALARTRR
jgi:hypothetical protein